MTVPARLVITALALASVASAQWGNSYYPSYGTGYNGGVNGVGYGGYYGTTGGMYNNYYGYGGATTMHDQCVQSCNAQWQTMQYGGPMGQSAYSGCVQRCQYMR
ncbi:hypothetical protein GQ42DRAFT_162766 [Ramicandelaber brevisporus]|nr:hypothetical protein GQ42DRAFT_162766 [Ramicandelaber brevisporus]